MDLFLSRMGAVTSGTDLMGKRKRVFIFFTDLERLRCHGKLVVEVFFKFKFFYMWEVVPQPRR
jgi:hypothetical protein